jgi:hypothetical protein
MRALSGACGKMHVSIKCRRTVNSLCPSFCLPTLFKKKGSVPIGEPFLVPGRTCCGKGFTWNQKGFFKGFSYGDSQGTLFGYK